jgi:hypothetical protein
MQRETCTLTCLSPAISIAPGGTQVPLPMYEQYNLLRMKGHSTHTTPNRLRHHSGLGARIGGIIFLFHSCHLR